jgi:hypothetical protein
LNAKIAPQRVTIASEFTHSEPSIEKEKHEARAYGVLSGDPPYPVLIPFAYPSWTIPMALVWIAFRSRERMVEQMDQWRERVRWYYDVDNDRMQLGPHVVSADWGIPDPSPILTSSESCYGCFISTPVFTSGELS